mgnify:CR=1 FL=1
MDCETCLTPLDLILGRHVGHHFNLLNLHGVRPHEHHLQMKTLQVVFVVRSFDQTKNWLNSLAEMITVNCAQRLVETEYKVDPPIVDEVREDVQLGNTINQDIVQI